MRTLEATELERFINKNKKSYEETALESGVIDVRCNYTKKVVEERLGKSITEIIEFVQETNRDMLDINSKRFEILIDDTSLENFIFSDTIFFFSVRIMFVKDIFTTEFYTINLENIERLIKI